jgi:hypothetical protein
MSDDKPSAFEDVRKGLGLLFRAARTTMERLPTKDLEEVVATSAREVGRALENVGKTIEREVLGGRKTEAAPPPKDREETRLPDAAEPPDEKSDRGPKGSGTV